MADFDHGDFRDGMPPIPPMGMGMGPGDNIYMPAAHYGPSGVLDVKDGKYKDSIDLEDVEEIPFTDFFKWRKAKKIYKQYYKSFNIIKERIYWNSSKLAKIDKKLAKYARYPDQVAGRSKLLDERHTLVDKMKEDQDLLLNDCRLGLQYYAKALGKDILDDSEFVIVEFDDNNIVKNERKKKKLFDFGSDEELDDEEIKEEEKTTEDKEEISKPEEKKEEHIEEEEKTNTTNIQKLLRLYELYVEKYGRVEAKKKLEEFIKSEEKKNSETSELDDMLNNEKNEVRKIAR